MNAFGYLEEVLLLFKELLCISFFFSILELCFMLTLVYMVCTSDLLCYFWSFDLIIFENNVIILI
jgi:hypothetical protein